MARVSRLAVHGWILPVMLFVTACGSPNRLAPVGRYEEPAKAERRIHTVQKGETLYSIAWRFGLDYRQLASWNGIREPYTIYPGQVILLKPIHATHFGVEEAKPGAVTSRTAPPSQPSRAGRAAAGTTAPPAQGTSQESGTGTAKRAGSAKAAKEPTKKAEKNVVRVNNSSTLRWRWPAKGKVVTTFSKSGRKGIDIAGRLGQPIYAASGGRVVYSGSGLIGYGKLIIVKHNKRHLSAYAHNNKIFVEEGDLVKGGQRIAEMGRTGAKRVMLHFEIRRDGRPIDPARYLPK